MYLDDLICYGLTRYEAEYGDFEGVYKLYSNYYNIDLFIFMLCFYNKF